MFRSIALLALVSAVVLAGCGRQEDPAQASASLEPGANFAAAQAIVPLRRSIDPADPRAQLGKRLFHAPALSADGTVSCATCHEIAEGGDDGRSLSVGVNATVGDYNAPTVLNSSLNFAQFWDGRAATLEDQVPGPIHNPKEMASSLDEVRARVAADPQLAAAFKASYSDGVTTNNIVDAIASYERALVTPNSAFDRFLAGDADALPTTAQQGYDLFLRLGCVSCHQGRNIGGNMFQHFGVMGNYFADRGNVTAADNGRFNVTGREADRYKFKVPSLRNVARTAPYFHDGSAADLDDAVRIMLRYQLGRSVEEDQVAKLVSFLESLTGTVDPVLL